jgi:hypothetical protein
MYNFEKENKLVWDAWYSSSDAIKDALGEDYTRENYEMISLLNVTALITDFDHANADEIKKNGDDFILFVRELINLKLQAFNAKQGKFQA